MKRVASNLFAICLIIISGIFGYFFNSKIVLAGDGWTDTSSCVASECETSNGTKNQVLYQEVCNKICPTVEFSTSRLVCPNGYNLIDWFGSKKCYKHNHPFQNPTTETFSVNVPYGDKSEDQNHCHKPTPESLDIPSWARGEYGKLETELDTINSDCHQEIVDTRTIACDNAEVIPCTYHNECINNACVSVLGEGTCECSSDSDCNTPVCEWSEWEPCSVECGGGTQVSYLRGDGCSNEARFQECNTQSCSEEPVCEWVWEECSVDCGGGTQVGYLRGEGCSNAQDTRECNTQSCDEEPTPTETPSPTPTETQSVGGFSQTSAPTCNDTVPPAPSILSVTSTGTNSVKITWTKVTPATSYSILYGTTSGNYPYSVFSTGNTDNFEINGIGRGGCFTVKAVNGCMPGPLSAEFCGGTVAGAVLGASTLGATGIYPDLAYKLILLVGSLFTAIGIKKLTSKE